MFVMMLIFQEAFLSLIFNTNTDKGMLLHNAKHPHNAKNLGNEFNEGVMVHVSLILDILLLRGSNNQAKNKKYQRVYYFYPLNISEKELT